MMLYSQHNKRFSGIWFLLLPLVMLTVGILQAFPSTGCKLEAYHHMAGDYCYRMKVTVSSLKTTALENYPALIKINSSDLVTQGFYETNGWSMRGYNSALGNVPLLLQDTNLNDASFWLSVNTTASNGTTPSTWNGWMYMGNPFVARDQGINFAGQDTVTVADDTALEWTDDFDIVVEAQVLSTVATQTNAGWVDKYEPVSNTGYYLGFDNGNVVAKVGDSTTTDTITAAWDGAEAKFRMRFDSGAANRLVLSKWNTSTNVWDPIAQGGTISAVAHNANNLVMGQGFTGILREVMAFYDVGLPTYTKYVQWSFNPLNIAESSAVDPNYSGTVDNVLNAAAHQGTYNFVRDQTGLSYTLGALMPVYASPAESIPERFANVLNNPAEADLFTTGTTNTNMPFYGTLETARAGMGLPANAFWVIVFGGVFGMLGIAILRATRRPELAAIAPGVGLLTGSFMGLLAPWITILFALAAIGVWLISKWGSE